MSTVPVSWRDHADSLAGRLHALEVADALSAGPANVGRALSDLAGAIDMLSSTADPDSMDELGVLYLLADVRDLRIRLAQVEAVIEGHAASAMTSDRVEAPDLLAERKGGNVRKKWEHDRLAERVTTAAITDKATGELAVEPDVAHGLVAEVLACAAVSYWRVGALKARGVRFDDACETETGRRTVHVSRSVTP